jgi:hypothetical protein
MGQQCAIMVPRSRHTLLYRQQWATSGFLHAVPKITHAVPKITVSETYLLGLLVDCVL